MQARGNAALALMLCVVSNLLGIVLVPFWLKGMLSGSNTSIDAVSLLIKLAITILAPLLVGKAIQTFITGIKGLVKQHKLALQIISNASLAIIVWQTISDAQVIVPCFSCTYLSHGRFASRALLVLILVSATSLHVSTGLCGQECRKHNHDIVTSVCRVTLQIRHLGRSVYLSLLVWQCTWCI